MSSVNRTIGEYEVTLSVVAPGAVNVRWKNAIKSLKTVPPKVKTDHAKEYGEIEELRKSIESSLKVQKKRIENFLVERRSIHFSHWLKHFSEHPLIGSVCVNLVWVFSTKSDRFTAIYKEGGFIDGNGLLLSTLANDVESVELWHPSMTESPCIQAWQFYAHKTALEQPFKQIFREHFRKFPSCLNSLFQDIWVRQYQFRKLIIDLGWSYSFRGNFENVSSAIKNFNDNYSCELEIESEGELYSNRGICLAVGLGEIRLYEGNRNIEFSEIPPQVASEIMREIDFVVSVSALGNNDDWIQLCENMEDSNRIELMKYLSSDKKMSSFARNQTNETEIALMSKFFGMFTSAYSRLPVFKTLEARVSFIKLWVKFNFPEINVEFDKRYVYVRIGIDHKICIATGLVYRLPESSIDIGLSKSFPRSKKRGFLDQLSHDIIRKIELINKMHG